MSRGDLHIHTTASDGRLTPAQVVDAVTGSGMSFFAIADHNTLAGLEEAEQILDPGGPEFVYGVELSVQPNHEQELHLLGYGFDRNNAILRDVCRRVAEHKKQQLRDIIELMREDGVDVDIDALPLEETEVYVGRPVLADLLVRNGVVNTVNQAFVRFLGENAQTFVPMRRLSPQVGIDAIHKAGGLAVLAHPSIDTVDVWLKDLVEMGLDGIEAYRPALTGNDQLYVEKAAEHFGIFVTGGADCHARGADDQPGAYSVKREYIEEFFRALDERAAVGVVNDRREVTKHG